MIEAWREQGNYVPVLVVSGLSSVDDRVRGLRAGGDDYLIKPFSLEELIARVRSLATAYGRRAHIRVARRPLTHGFDRTRVRRADRELDLLPREFELLEYLCAIRIWSSPAPCC